MLRNYVASCVAVLVLVFSPHSSGASSDRRPEYSDNNFPVAVFFGDTHLHTNLSVDAYNFGNRLLGPEEAYRFAKGKAVRAHNGMRARLRRPLDFLVIADHASNLGVMVGLEEEDPDLLESELARSWLLRYRQINESGKSDRAAAARLSHELFLDGFRQGEAANSKYRQTVWSTATRLADEHNEPGKFTTFIGYEWSHIFYNLHRVVVFKDSAAKASRVLPFSQYDSSDPEDLWAYLDNYEKMTGGEVLAIPHNGNLSTGVMFALENARGEVLTQDYARVRSRWEPLFEVTQIKGDSETHPILSPDDEFSDYETLSLKSHTLIEVKKQRGINVYDGWLEGRWKENDPTNNAWARTYEYARSGLKLGLEQQSKLGVNPFKFGMIGSTDSHTSLATADEDNFWGKLTEAEPHATRIVSPWRPDMPVWQPGWRMAAAGLAAVWAEENTRESLFAAMKRKEVYATTGPRMSVRFFGGWDYEENDAFRPDLARIGYTAGVPMGGDLARAPEGAAPSFLIRAVKDPDGANLDRVQVIKGWRSKDGELREKVYDVALSDGREIRRNGRSEPVGNTVDLADASYTNTIGDPELSVVWKDPDFDADELAFYYVRVLEIPTPRWTAYDAKYFGVPLGEIPEEAPMITQERAYTSPIWYTP